MLVPQKAKARLTNGLQSVIIRPLLDSRPFYSIAPVGSIRRLLKTLSINLRILGRQQHESITVVSCLRWRRGCKVAHQLWQSATLFLAGRLGIHYVRVGVVLWLELQASHDPVAHLCLDGLCTARGVWVSEDKGVGCILLRGSRIRAQRVDLENRLAGNICRGKDIL